MMLAEKVTLQSQTATESPASSAKKRRFSVLFGVHGMIIAIALVVLACALMYVGQRTHLMTLSYQLDQLQDELKIAQREQAFLQLQIVEARSLERVEQLATGRLGMVRPNAVQYVAFEKEHIDAQPAGHDIDPSERGFIALAVDWVAKHWPRMDSAEAGGDSH